MEFLNTNIVNEGLSAALFVGLFLVIGIFFVGSFVFLTENEKNTKNITKFFSLILTTLAFVWLFFIFTNSLNDKGKEETENFTSNIKMKYDVDDIVFEHPSIYSVGAGETEAQEIIVVVDGKDVMFTITQDPETFEPTLKDMPLMSGNPAGEVVTVNDILK